MRWQARTSWWARAAVIAVGLLLLAALVVSRVVGHIFEVKLVRAADQKLHAKLTIGQVFYRPPLAFYLRNVELAPQPGTGRAIQFSAGAVSLNFAHLPRKGQPPTLKSLVIHDAILKQERAGAGIPLSRLELAMKWDQKAGKYIWDAKLSEGAGAQAHATGSFDEATTQLDLNELSLNAQVAALLRTVGKSAGQVQSLKSSAPDGKLAISGSGQFPLNDLAHASYRFVLTLDGAAARVRDLKMNLRGGSARVVVQQAAPSAAGRPVMEAIVQAMQVASSEGHIHVDSGVVTISPLEKTWRLRDLVGTLELGNQLPFFLPRSGWFFNRGEFRGPVKFTLAADGPLRLEHGQSPLEAIHHELLAYPHDVWVRPRNFPQAIEHVTGGPIACRGGVITFKNLTGIYGRDKLLLQQARLILENPVRHITLDDLRSRVRFEEIAGTVIFSGPEARYPGVIGKAIDQLRPRGQFVIGGGSWYAVNRPPRFERMVLFEPDYFIRLLGDGGTLSPTQFRIPLTKVQGEATFAPLSIDIKGFKASALKGTVWAAGGFVPGTPLLYQGEIDFRNLNLADAAHLLPVDASARQKLTGLASANAHLSGSGNAPGASALDSLVLDAECQVIRGNFWSVPTVQGVADRVGKSQPLGDADAAGIVHIEKRKVYLQSAAINSPLLGLLGSGTIGFDKSLDLTVVAAPLGDWRDKLRQAGVPLAGDLLGAVQQLLNAAQGTLFYQYHITGNLKHPAEALVPLPILSEPMAALFGQMLRQDQNGRLLADVNRQSQRQPGNRPPEPQPAASRIPATKPARPSQKARVKLPICECRFAELESALRHLSSIQANSAVAVGQASAFGIRFGGGGARRRACAQRQRENSAREIRITSGPLPHQS